MHALGDGGYPTLSGNWRPGVLAQVVATADCYVSLQSRLSHSTPGVSPHEALGRMLGGYPIEACPWPKRLWYFVRRHQAVAATTCVSLLLLVAALGFLGRSWWENRRALALSTVGSA